MATRKKPVQRIWKEIMGTTPVALERAATLAINDVLKVKPGERVLIITNPQKDVFTISTALYTAALARGADPNLIVQPQRSPIDFASDTVIHALRAEPEVIISTSADKLGKDRFGLEKPYRFKGHKGSWPNFFHALLATGKSRSFWSPSVTLDTFTRTVAVDYTEMRKKAKKLAKSLDAAEWASITSPGGTNLDIGLQGRIASLDDGSFHKPGSGGNLPAGETYISPDNYTAEGTIVFDGSLSLADGTSAFIPKKPVTVTVEDGLVTSVKGGPGAKRFENSLIIGEKTALKMKGKPGWTKAKVDYYHRNARHLGELGIGLNPAAKVTGNMLEDEKILGTCHIAIGSNYDNDAEAFIHLDCLIDKPTITVHFKNGRKRVIVEAGQPL